MLYTLCVTCDENFVVEEPELEKPRCPKCGRELGVLGLALMWDEDEAESVEGQGEQTA
jgi:hypothetical protein